jgi:hypothetical protein
VGALLQMLQFYLFRAQEDVQGGDPQVGDPQVGSGSSSQLNRHKTTQPENPFVLCGSKPTPRMPKNMRRTSSRKGKGRGRGRGVGGGKGGRAVRGHGGRSVGGEGGGSGGGDRGGSGGDRGGSGGEDRGGSGGGEGGGLGVEDSDIEQGGLGGRDGVRSDLSLNLSMESIPEVPPQSLQTTLESFFSPRQSNRGKTTPNRGKATPTSGKSTASLNKTTLGYVEEDDDDEEDETGSSDSEPDDDYNDYDLTEDAFDRDFGMDVEDD